MKKLLAALLLLPVAVFAQTPQPLTIAVIPKGSTSIFWKIYEAGARKAAGELGVEVVVRSTRFESDFDAQVQIVEYFREKKVNAIVITPLHRDTLVAPVERAVADGITVVVTDSALNSTKPVAYIASDNFQAGRLSGTTAVKLLGPAATGEVALLRYLKGSDSTENREKGVIQEVKAGLPKVTLVDNYYSGAILGDAKRACDTMLDEHPNLTGIVAITTISTNGLVKSLQQKSAPGKITVVGSGSSDEAIAALRAGLVQALVVQNPFEMGYRGVKTAVASLKGEKVAKEFFTDVVVVTAANIDTPEIQQLLNP